MEKFLNLAILSDLHCHPHSYSPSNTVLYSDGLRLPSKGHPIENLIDLISDRKLEANVVICPGDFSHHANRQGLLSGWSFVNEIARAFDNIPIISTIGNHDIDSRNQENSYSFNDVKLIDKNFPLEEKYLESFWSKGFATVCEEDYIVLVVNSCFYHTHLDKNIIDNGKIDPLQLEQIEASISGFKDDDRIKILLVHHHPVQHERFELGDYDFIKNGEDLMKVIAENNFDLVIHGHKHDPWLRYYNPKFTISKIPVLSSGSFSATSQKLYADVGNYFHTVEIRKIGGKARGKVTTYSYKIRGGWSLEKHVFYPFSGFGNSLEIREIVNLIEAIFKRENKQLIKWNELVSEISDLEYLLPDEIDSLKVELQKVNIGFPNLGVSPDVVYYYGS